MWRNILSEIAQRLTEAAYRYIPASGAETVVLTAPLKPHETRLLDKYQGDLYKLYNFVLRYGVAPANWYTYRGRLRRTVTKDSLGRMALGATKVLRRLFSRSATREAMVVYRGVGHYGEFGGSGTAPGTFPSIPKDKTLDADRLEVNLRAMQAKLRGYAYTYKKFISTSRHARGIVPFVYTRNPSIVWRFLVPAKTPALDLTALMTLTGAAAKNPYSSVTFKAREAERELLFPPGTAISVVDIQVAHPSRPPATDPAWREAYADSRLAYTQQEVQDFYQAFDMHDWEINGVEEWIAHPVYIVTATLTAPMVRDNEPLPDIEPDNPLDAPDELE